MKEIFKTPLKERNKKIKKIKKVLQKREEILFAYVFGSFLKDPMFRDIDIGVYLKEEEYKKEKGSFEYNFRLADEIEKEIGSAPMVDIRILNGSSYTFLNNIFSRGKLLFYRDEKFLTDLIEDCSKKYIANAYFSHQSLKELISS